ncbi:hypothetical protein AVEN_113585-1 [Araneus ventricosus]|uniref:Uncharacterized protein n=1 Tax=Araneus ventricosus TaxID=182803 RepID=A0A4Y2JDY8_ARAVE|nr:hypothetical protein AVEN_113585-1 [Araneus ventricosus]
MQWNPQMTEEMPEDIPATQSNAISMLLQPIKHKELEQLIFEQLTPQAYSVSKLSCSHSHGQRDKFPFDLFHLKFDRDIQFGCEYHIPNSIRVARSIYISGSILVPPVTRIDPFGLGSAR